jgi:hypothetical protein
MVAGPLFTVQPFRVENERASAYVRFADVAC